MREKVRIDIPNDEDNKIYEKGTVFKPVEILEKSGNCLINYENSIKGHYLDFYMDTPSNQSFMIFGGLYDPKTGLMYATVNKNHKSVIAFDCVEVLSNHYKDKEITVKSITDAFISYKLSGKISNLNQSFKEKKGKSIIYKHLTKGDNTNYSDDLDFFRYFFAYNISSVVNNVFTANKNSKLPYVSVSFIDYPLTALNVYSINVADETSLYYISSVYNMKISKYGIPYKAYGYSDKEIDYTNKLILKENIEELYDTKETLVYSKDTVSTLRRNGFAGYVNKSNIKGIQITDNLSDLYNSYHLDTSMIYTTKNDIRTQNRDHTLYGESSVIFECIQQLIYLNKTFRKLSK